MLATATEPIDSAWGLAGMGYMRVDVSLPALVRGELAPGDYELYIDLHEASGPKAGNVSRNRIQLAIVEPERADAKSLAATRPGGVNLQFAGMRRGTMTDVAVFRATNDSSGTLKLVALHVAGGAPPANPNEIGEGEAVWMAADFAGLPFETEEGNRNPRFFGSFRLAAPSTLSFPPGVSATFQVDLSTFRPGVGTLVPQIVEGWRRDADPRPVLQSPLIALLRDDVGTTGPVLLCPRPAQAGRPGWRLVPLEAPDWIVP